LPGQGDSDKPADGYDTKTTAERIHVLLDKLGETSYVFVGHDIGSWVGYAFGADEGSAPDLYDRMKPLANVVYGGVIENSGHYIPEEQPAALAQKIINFINTLN